MSRNLNRILTNADHSGEADSLERWAQLLLLRSTPNILIFALPGAGKTYFANGLRKKGISVVDSDDITDEVTHEQEEPETASKLSKNMFYQHDFAWRLPLAAWPSTTRIAVTGLQPTALLEVVKLGYTTIFVDIPLGDYIERASTRADLVDKPLTRWWEEARGVRNIANITVESFDDVYELVTSHISGFGSRSALLNVDRERGSRRAVGRMLRDNILLWALRVGYTPHFIGSEIETPSMLARFGMKARVSGLGVIDPIGFPKVLDVEGQASYRESDGQRKLSAMDFPFATANVDTVIAVGGTPGSHFMETLRLGNKRLVIVDPREPAVLDAQINVKWISAILGDVSELSAYMTKPFVFLSDIRSDDFTEADVARDNALQFIWFSTLMTKYAKNCRGVSLKFRPPHDSVSFELPSNMINVFQVHNAGQSMETRMFWKPSLGTKFRMERHATQAYTESVVRWNIARTNTPSLEVKQERVIASWLIENIDYTAFKPERSELLVGLYTISNGRRKEEVIELLRRWDSSGVTFVVNLPFGPIFDYLASAGDGVSLTGGGGDDVSMLPSDFLGTGLSVYSIADWIATMDQAWGQRGFYPREPDSCCSGAPYMREWFIVTNVKLKGEEHIFQTGLNSQTWCVKYITAALRDVWGHTNSSLHAVRREVVVAYGGVGVDDPRVNGEIVVDGRTVYVSVSGHLINMLIAANLHVIDFDRWLDTVRSNIWAYYNKRGASAWKRLYRKGILAENGQRYDYPRLYHGYYDFKLAEMTVEVMAGRFGFRLDNRVVAYVAAELEKLLVSYPKWKYDISSDAANYASSAK